MLRTVHNDGVKSTPKIHFGPDNIPFGERNEYRVALPEYDVQYNSAHIKPTVKLGSFDKERRELKLAAVCYHNDSASPSSPKKSPSSPKKQRGGSEHMSVYEQRCSLVALPKLKTRVPEKLVFNDSSYRKKFREPLDITPTLINKVASVHLFDGLLAIPRKHVSVGFSSNAHGLAED